MSGEVIVLLNGVVQGQCKGTLQINRTIFSGRSGLPRALPLERKFLPA